MLEELLKLIPKLSEKCPIFDTFGGTMFKYIPTWDRSSSLLLQMTSFQAYTILSVPKKIPWILLRLGNHFFPNRIFRTPCFWFFFGKILWRRNKFQLTNYLFYVEINYEIKGVRFDQMKTSGGGTEPKKTEMMYFQQSIRNFISSTWLKVTKRSPVRLGKLISFTENLKN